MRKTLFALLLICATMAQGSQEDPAPPKIELCKLGSETYTCIYTTMGKERYLAIFAKDGKSLVRVTRIERSGKHYLIYP